MRWLALALMLMSSIQPALAQNYYCSRPTEPYIRSAYSADFDQMERTRREVEAYIDEMNDYLACLADEHSDASNEADSVIDEWNRTVRNFNNQ